MSVLLTVFTERWLLQHKIVIWWLQNKLSEWW